MIVKPSGAWIAAENTHCFLLGAVDSLLVGSGRTAAPEAGETATSGTQSAVVCRARSVSSFLRRSNTKASRAARSAAMRATHSASSHCAPAAACGGGGGGGGGDGEVDGKGGAGYIFKTSDVAKRRPQS